LNKPVYFIGLMSGTSMDAVDVALADLQDDDVSVIDYRQFPIPREVQTAVRSLNSQAAMVQITELDVILGRLFSEAVKAMLESTDIRPESVTAIGSHGQTVLHLPDDTYPRTLQIADPNIIAYETGITTVTDFRRLDIAAGGQGAPLASAFHAWRFRSVKTSRVVLNLGGMANITILPAGSAAEISGFDTGPGNALMDEWTRVNRRQDYDENGQWAASGCCNADLLDCMLDDPYFSLPPPKSTGKDRFNLDWLAQKRKFADTDCETRDIQATLLELTARTITDAITAQAPDTGEILLCGGGTHNHRLVQRLQELLPEPVIITTEAYGIHPDAVEAVTFAWLAKCRLEHIPGNVPAVTGAAEPLVLGSVYEPSRRRKRNETGK